MERITPKEVTSMMEAVAAVYEKKGDCVDKKEKGAHNCAKKVCHEEYGEGECIFGQHAVPDENGFVSHYDVQFEHGIVENVSVEDLEILISENHPTAEGHRYEGEVVDENVLNYLGDKFKKGADQIKGFFAPGGGVNPNRAFSGRGAGRSSFRDSNIPADSNIKQSGGGLNQGEKPQTQTQTQTQKPQLTDQQKVRAEYDRLRKLDPKTGKVMGSPEDLKKAAEYGKAMAKAGAAKKDFSGYKSAADLSKSDAKSDAGPGGYQIPAGARPIKSATTPAAAAVAATATNNYPGGKVGATGAAKPAAAKPAAATPAARPSTAQVRGREAMMAAQRNRAAKPAPTPAVKAPATPAAKPAGSIAQRLQAIRDMRAASQSRIAAQGGTPATPAANPTPKSTPPSTTGATTTPTAKPVAKVDKKQSLKNGDPMERMTGKGAASLMDSYSKVYEEREPQAIDEGIMGVLKKVGKAVLGPADQSPEAEAARMGKRRRPKKAGTPMKTVAVEDADLFDIIKGHFIEEGLTEEEALTKMLDLTDEERTEIIEGSCGSKKKKKSKKGGY